VAVKLIKAGMDSKQVIARFDAERQALALMDHPNIAKVLDAGTTSTGRPYFVMEIVKGVPITKYCDEHRLTPRQRLELFLPVCQAVQHAHQKGVIHRDLKPSNVLVALYDGKPVPKVIDFGVAKATGQSLTQQTLVTGFGNIVGTLEYMSPEQAEINQLDIDTRSDIYSLGVLLYELLTGTTPFTKKELEKAGMLEMLRVIREQEPTKPSTKLSTAEGLPTLAANRGMEPAKLTKLLRGELDWIVMKALEKDRNRRYETANGFAMDLQRYLADEPVLACPPSTIYRIKKFVRRNKGPVLAVSMVVLGLIAGIVGTTVGLLSAEAARKDAVDAQKAEAEQHRTADEERAIAQAVNDFLQKDLLGQVDLANQTGPRDSDIKVRTVLDRAARAIGNRFAKQPRVEAAIRLTIAKAYFALADSRQARVHAERSLELRIANLGPDHTDTLSSKDVLAEVYHAENLTKEAEALWEEVVEKRSALLGPDHLDTLAAKSNLAHNYLVLRQFDRAELLLQEVAQKRLAKLGPDDVDTLWSKNNLAWLHRQVGKHDLAAKEFLELQKAFVSNFGEDHPGAQVTRSNLALVYCSQKRFAQAESLLHDAVKQASVLHGPDHPWTLDLKNHLAWAYSGQRKYADAVELLEKTLTAGKVTWGEEYHLTLSLMHQLGYAYRRNGKPVQARALFEEFMKRLQRQTHVSLAQKDQANAVRFDLAVMDLEDKKPEKAIPIFEEALSALKDQHELDHSSRLYVTWLLARALLDAERSDEALRLLNEYLDRSRKQLGTESMELARRLNQIGSSLLRPKHYSEAEKHFRESLAIRVKIEPDAWNTFYAQSMLGAALLGQQKYADAAPLLVQGYEGMKQREVKIPSQARVFLTEALERLVQLYDAWEKPKEAMRWREELAAHKKDAKKVVPSKEK
jgi:eukaryotic-like serine/threonine-protein kinase